MEVILPAEYYQVRREGELVWDNVGLRAYSFDVARIGRMSVEDGMFDSWHRVLWEVGKMILGKHSREISNFVNDKMSLKPRVVPVVDPQLLLEFRAREEQGV